MPQEKSTEKSALKHKSRYTVSIGVLAQIIQYLSFRGAETEQLLSQLGIDPELFHHPDERISVDKYIIAEKSAAKILKDPCLGLHMGQHNHARNWTILGYMMLNCKNVLEAFHKFMKYSDILGNLIQCEVIVKQDTVKLCLTELKDAPVISEHCYEGYFSCLVNLAANITGTVIQPKEVGLVSLKREYLEEYIKIFGKNTIYLEKDNYMIFDKREIELPAVFPNQNLLDYFENYAQELMKGLDNRDSFTYRTKKLMLSMMDSNSLCIASIARELYISERTLQVNLKKEGTEFSELLRDTRIQLAKKYLQEGYSIEDITYLLGFSDVSVFRKAFKKWLGMTPREFRQLN